MNGVIQKSWERRSKIFGTSKKAVMSQTYSSLLSEYIHKIHLQEILAVLPNKKYLCLDVGCGYGRIASELILPRPKLYVYGIDISRNFVKLFNQKMRERERGKAIEGDVRNLPFKDKFFDFVWTVMTLIYVHKEEDRQRAIKEMLRVLKPGREAIFIELNNLGQQWIRLWGLLPFFYRVMLKKKKVETFEKAFKWNYLDRIIKRASGEVMEKRGYSCLTLFFVPILLSTKVFPRLGEFFLHLTAKFDEKFPMARFSFFVIYKVKKL